MNPKTPPLALEAHFECFFAKDSNVSLSHSLSINSFISSSIARPGAESSTNMCATFKELCRARYVSESFDDVDFVTNCRARYVSESIDDVDFVTNFRCIDRVRCDDDDDDVRKIVRALCALGRFVVNRTRSCATWFARIVLFLLFT